ncbi:MAG: ribbon-helix-helix protein, CopG family [Spirochaetaceae bacterium]|nr:MAG: ribbon-helix-helix protein, CopG family [Spirochaetaceae bacterium]
MKPVQVMFDEDILRRLSESDEVKERGRSEVVRRAVDRYLRQREQEAIARKYTNAYAATNQLEDELGGWTEEGAWPTE